jgi:hypothetical protein
VFFPRAREITETSAAGRAAAAFVWDAGPVVHAIAFFFESVAIVIEWWASERTYESTIGSVYGRMLGSYRDSSSPDAPPPAGGKSHPTPSPTG